MSLDKLVGISLEKVEPDFASGAPFEACCFHVCRRAGLPCYRCGTDIIKGRFSGRMGYLCPACQRNSIAGADFRHK